MNREVLIAFVVAACCGVVTSLAASAKEIVAPVRLAEEQMTPFELVLTKDIPAGTELRLRQESRLRPVIVGVYGVTSITVSGVDGELPLRDVPTFDDIRGKWGTYEQGGQMAILKVPEALSAGTRLTVQGRKYEGVSPVAQRFAWRQAGMWLEPLDAPTGIEAAVSEPLIVRTVAGPVEYLKAYRKADGRLQIQAFDKQDNPADDTGAT